MTADRTGGEAPRPRQGNAERDAAEEGGDPACLLHLVCEACGRVADESGARACGRCGADLPGAQHPARG